MSKLNDEIQEVYKNLDHLQEMLELDNTSGKNEKHLKLLDNARDSLNRYLSVVEKFDRTGKSKS